MKKTVATIKWNFDSSKTIDEIIIKLPECTEILSVYNDNSSLSIVFISPTQLFNTNLWREYHFTICKCAYTDIDVTDCKYVGTVNEGNCSFVLFYKKGLIV